eukprot:TRINITY_DN11702_c1_g1_i1.p1 TRINITY_DN11702_c1_g1~~TRINITY_DN11702_c1_g1_i1.p1  ORF type:complete len:390 (+),score=91.58 TRINITY_DN11702_c1_g1_i1:63-1232(+)
MCAGASRKVMQRQQQQPLGRSDADEPRCAAGADELRELLAERTEKLAAAEITAADLRAELAAEREAAAEQRRRLQEEVIRREELESALADLRAQAAHAQRPALEERDTAGAAAAAVAPVRIAQGCRVLSAELRVERSGVRIVDPSGATLLAVPCGSGVGILPFSAPLEEDGEPEVRLLAFIGAEGESGPPAHLISFDEWRLEHLGQALGDCFGEEADSHSPRPVTASAVWRGLGEEDRERLLRPMELDSGRARSGSEASGSQRARWRGAATPPPAPRHGGADVAVEQALATALRRCAELYAQGRALAAECAALSAENSALCDSHEALQNELASLRGAPGRYAAAPQPLSVPPPQSPAGWPPPAAPPPGAPAPDAPPACEPPRRHWVLGL